jgi:hypothetical protein
MRFFNKKNNIRYSLEDIKSNQFILHHHLGLGDSINCNGMVNFLSKSFEKIYLPAKSNYYEMLNYMYQNNQKVEIFKLESNLYNLERNYTVHDFKQMAIQEYEQIEDFARKKKLEILRVGFDKLKMPIPKAFYDQLNLPFEYSKKYFNAPYNLEKNTEYSDRLKKIYNSSNKYSLLHLESRMEFYEIQDFKLLTDFSTIKIEKSTDIYKNIFFYQKLIKEAQEIHVLNSSIFCLADRVETSGKLYVHNKNKQEDFRENMSLFKNWNIVNYF